MRYRTVLFDDKSAFTVYRFVRDIEHANLRSMGAREQHKTQFRQQARNLEIPGSMLRIAPE